MEEEHRKDEKCLEPFSYLSKIPGKDVRGSLIDCFQQWLNIPNDKIIIIKDIIASLHNASLLVDDIEDNSKLRRGLPVAHSIFGVANTINCANYVYFLALEKCHSLKNDKAMTIFVQELLNLHRGQGQDILWREQCICPTEEMYKQMVLDKTGGLFRLSVGLMQAFSDIELDFTELLNQLGLYFQIRDDFLNVSSIEYMQTKSFCEDLTEGKFSYPIIHAVHSRPDDSRLLNILRQRTEDVEIKKHAVDWMDQCGSIDYTRNSLRLIHTEVSNQIEILGGHTTLTKLLSKLDSQLDQCSTPPLEELNSDKAMSSISHITNSNIHLASKIFGTNVLNKNKISTL